MELNQAVLLTAALKKHKTQGDRLSFSQTAVIARVRLLAHPLFEVARFSGTTGLISGLWRQRHENRGHFIDTVNGVDTDAARVLFRARLSGIPRPYQGSATGRSATNNAHLHWLKS